MNKKLTVVTLLVMSQLLTACPGGGGGSAQSVADDPTVITESEPTQAEIDKLAEENNAKLEEDKKRRLAGYEETSVSVADEYAAEQRAIEQAETAEQKAEREKANLQDGSSAVY